MQARIILHAIWCAKFIISTHFYTFLIVATSSVTQALILMVLDIFVANLVVCSGVALERTAFLIAQRTVQCGIRRGAAVGMKSANAGFSWQMSTISSVTCHSTCAALTD